MRILGERAAFQADHSSTSYLFYSPRRLDEETRRLAASFSRRADVGIHSAAYTYNVEGYDLPTGAEDQLFAGSFEVMVSESYDWWTFAFTLPHSAKAIKRLQPFDNVFGPDDSGFGIARVKSGNKIKITFSTLGDHASLRACLSLLLRAAAGNAARAVSCGEATCR